MAGAGLPPPAGSSGGAGLPANRKAIVKACWEDASIGLDGGSVVAADAAPREIAARRARFETGFFAESYIEGREFNLSLLEGPEGAVVLPPAEIVFRGYGDDRPRVVDSGAKLNTEIGRAPCREEVCTILQFLV